MLWLLLAVLNHQRLRQKMKMATTTTTTNCGYALIANRTLFLVVLSHVDNVQWCAETLKLIKHMDLVQFPQCVCFWSLFTTAFSLNINIYHRFHFYVSDSQSSHTVLHTLLIIVFQDSNCMFVVVVCLFFSFALLPLHYCSLLLG